LKAIFITGTAGSGKSLLASILKPWYLDKGLDCIIVNLDPGAYSLPYTPDVDVRDFVNIDEIMERYELGPNGALILSADLIATSLNELQRSIDELNPEITIIDTPGQVELFAYRNSGPFMLQNLMCEEKVVLFLFDLALVATPINFVSVALLSASIQLRLRAPQINVLSKRDLGDWRKVMKWSSDLPSLENAIRKHTTDDELYLLSRRLLLGLVKSGISFELYPVSSVTHEGLVELSAALMRILRGGEEVED
jgi:hypothetical protein